MTTTTMHCQHDLHRGDRAVTLTYRPHWLEREQTCPQCASAVSFRDDHPATVAMLEGTPATADVAASIIWEHAYNTGGWMMVLRFDDPADAGREYLLSDDLEGDDDGAVLLGHCDADGEYLSGDGYAPAQRDALAERVLALRAGRTA